MTLWEIGTQELGMSDAEWRALTPRLLLARIERHRANEQRQNLRAGLIAAEIRNSIRSKRDDKVWTASDFFPDLDADDAEDEASDMDCDVEGIMQMFRGLRPGLN